MTWVGPGSKELAKLARLLLFGQISFPDVGEELASSREGVAAASSRAPGKSQALVRLLLLAFLLPIPVRADGPLTATLDGRVLDAADGPLAAVTVTLEGPQGSRHETTDQNGGYRFRLLSPGRYTLSVDLGALGSLHRGVALEPGGHRSLDLRPTAAPAETIVVTGSPTAEEAAPRSRDPGLSLALAADALALLPFNSRHFQSTIESFPGVIQDASSRTTGDRAPAFAGGESWENATLVEGVDTSFPRSGGRIRLYLPSSALDEVRLHTVAFGVEYGRATSGVIRATVKAGGERFHGVALWTPQSERWRSPYAALDIPRSSEMHHGFETSLGGPLLPRSAWFFASYAHTTTNRVDQLADGTPVDASFRGEPALLKLNSQLGERHRLGVVAIESPIDNTFLRAGSADRFTACDCSLDGSLATLSWSFAVSNDWLLETKVASQDEIRRREPATLRDLAPAASPDDPRGNHSLYFDRDTGLRYNGLAVPTGRGYDDLPRDQANLAVSWLRPRHQIRFGFDRQKVVFTTTSELGELFQGLGYDPDLPGGFSRPQFKRRFDPSGEITTSSRIHSSYVEDRFDLGRRWILSLGLRADRQILRNDLGEDAGSWTRLSPRIAAAYDLRGDGSLLLRASAGRYVQTIAQVLVDREYARLPNGTNRFVELGWNPQTRRYDRFRREATPTLDQALSEVDPYSKDELSLGIHWRLHPHWTLHSRWVSWSLSDLYWSTDQYDAEGRVVRDVRNWEGGFREHRGFVLELERRLHRGFSARLGYASGSGRGNMFELDDDDLFEGLGGVEIATGRTDATVRNRAGRGPSDRSHNLHFLGVRQLTLGAHVVSLAAQASWISGERWGQLASTDLRHPLSGELIRTTTYLEPRDSNQLEDTFRLDLGVRWRFPLRSSLRGELGLEVTNLTDRQQVIGINERTAEPLPGVRAYQAPREVRLQLGVRF